MKKTLLITFLTTAMLMLSSVDVLAQVRILPNKPQKPIKKHIVKQPVKQKKGYTWIQGHWKWSIYRNRYIWVNGYWKRNNPGFHWVPGKWVKVPNGWKWEEGHWNKNNPTHAIKEYAHPLKPVVNKPPKPAPNYVWVDGHFHWSESQQNYIWVSGHWKMKKKGFKWVPGHYEFKTVGRLKVKVWVSGKWERI